MTPDLDALESLLALRIARLALDMPAPYAPHLQAGRWRIDGLSVVREAREAEHWLHLALTDTVAGRAYNLRAFLDFGFRGSLAEQACGLAARLVRRVEEVANAG